MTLRQETLWSSAPAEEADLRDLAQEIAQERDWHEGHEGRAGAHPKRSKRRQRRCYLCIEERRRGEDASAEGVCESCGRPVCWIHGCTYISQPEIGPFYCSFGDTCPSARYEQWTRQNYLIIGLLEGDTMYPRENLIEFVKKHLLRWKWATEDRPYHPWYSTSPEDKRRMLRAVAKAQRLLGRDVTKDVARKVATARSR